MSTATPIRILSVNVALPEEVVLSGETIRTAICKQPVPGPVALHKENIAGDYQAALEFHGGPDRALCVYPHEHYARWEQEYNITLPLGAFGENLTATGMTEADVCIGDRFQWGDALLEVTQPRIPCAKVDKRNNAPGLFLRWKELGYTGYFLRVLQEGTIGPDLPITRFERHPAGVTVALVNQTFFHDKTNADAIRQILAVPALAPVFQQLFRDQLAKLEA